VKTLSALDPLAKLVPFQVLSVNVMTVLVVISVRTTNDRLSLPLPLKPVNAIEPAVSDVGMKLSSKNLDKQKGGF
jgi:hypothetical protein